MKRFGVGVAFAMIIGASLSLVAMGGAYATGVSCKKVSGKITGTVSISTCSPVVTGYTTLSGQATKLVAGGTLTWAPNKKTTIIKDTATQKGTGCKAPAKEYDVTGSVTGGTATYTKKGDIIKGRVCVNTTLGTVALVPGTSITL
jgi:hypothetical protein